MHKIYSKIGLLCSLFSLSACNFQPQITQYEGWDLVWHDEFDKDGKPDSSSWTFEHGFVRNKELQWYQSDNAICKDGILTIEGRQEKIKNHRYKPESHSWKENREFANYTSSCIHTRNKREFKYGRFEIRAKIPVSSGAWPAIWTLGKEKPWPSCGEIDIMEYYKVKGIPTILANAACESDDTLPKWNSAKIPFSHFLEKDAEWGNKFHTWRMDWDQEFIRLYLDDEFLNKISLSTTINGKAGDYKNPFKTPHYLLLNLAMGRNGGNIDHSKLPMRYEIDYVRIYQKKKAPYQAFYPGKIWEDTEGTHINAHGGGILYHNGIYYWYGEHKSEHTSSALVGINVYSSTDLYNWKKEGIALSVEPENSGHDIEKGCIMERPKVIYNEKTKKFVMWFHLELKDQGYKAARYAVAVSDNPTGPFKYLYSSRSCPSIWPKNMSQDAIKLAQKNIIKDRKDKNFHEKVASGGWLSRDFKEGQMSRDMTLFVDDNGKAYHIFSSEENFTLHIVELSDDYLYHTNDYVRVAPNGHNEAPSIFKYNGTYWMITSGCTGWKPNAARMFSAQNIMGPWKQYPNPCIGKDAEKTFGGQSTFILPIHGQKDKFIFMADIWRPKNPISAKYLWIPLQFKNNIPYLEYKNQWNLKSFN